MKAVLVALLALPVLVACGVEGDAKKGVKALLNDPESAQFYDLKRNSTGKNVCGFFNAKNRMGGYVGRTPFMYEGLTQTTAIVQPVEDSDFRRLWLGLRSGDFQKEFSDLRHKCRYAKEWLDTCGTPYPERVHPMCEAALGPGDALYVALKEKYGK